MQVWIGFQRDDAYVHEWTGEVAEESDMGKAIGNAIGNAILTSIVKPDDSGLEVRSRLSEAHRFGCD